MNTHTHSISNSKENLAAFDVLIIGGGLAGLCNAIHLSKFGTKVLLIEKNEYPKHKVCGEYISNEVLPYLQYLEIDPFRFGAVKIDTFQLSTTTNKLISAKLPLGGFGISRYQLDFILSEKAKKNNVLIIQDTVTDVDFKEDVFSVETKNKQKFTSKICIGSYGKRSTLDIKLKRGFIKKRSPYLGVKFHVKGIFSENLVALHNFKGGYCGVSKVENNTINVCYITNFLSFQKYKNINDFENKSLLIVDDDNPFRERLARAMEKKGFEVVQAESVQKGIESVKSKKPGFAVVDLRLGDGNGLEVVKQIQTTNSESRIIMLTGYGNIPTAVAAIKEGAIDYLAKPADAEDVEKALLADPSKRAAPPENPMSADRVKWEHIHRVFELCNRNVSETARRLKMHRRTLQRILSKRSPR